jgi:hypothetical protein
MKISISDGPGARRDLQDQEGRDQQIVEGVQEVEHRVEHPAQRQELLAGERIAGAVLEYRAVGRAGDLHHEDGVVVYRAGNAQLAAHHVEDHVVAVMLHGEVHGHGAGEPVGAHLQAHAGAAVDLVDVIVDGRLLGLQRQGHRELEVDLVGAVGHEAVGAERHGGGRDGRAGQVVEHVRRADERGDPHRVGRRC